MTLKEVGDFSKLNSCYKYTFEIVCTGGLRNAIAGSGLVGLLVEIPLVA
jgi:hypothetical protein